MAGRPTLGRHARIMVPRPISGHPCMNRRDDLGDQDAHRHTGRAGSRSDKGHDPDGARRTLHHEVDRQHPIVPVRLEQSPIE